MKKFILIFLAIIIIFSVSVFGGVMLWKNKNPEDTEFSYDNTVDENIVQENVVNEVNNELTENTVTNEVKNSTKNENTSNEERTEVGSSAIYEQNNDVGSTDKKQEAIKLVKEKWGEDSSVTFNCDSVTSKGEYIIAVISKETANVSCYFRVNLTNKTAEIEY